jgi:hypothetical protein
MRVADLFLFSQICSLSFANFAHGIRVVVAILASPKRITQLERKKRFFVYFGSTGN